MSASSLSEQSAGLHRNFQSLLDSQRVATLCLFDDHFFLASDCRPRELWLLEDLKSSSSSYDEINLRTPLDGTHRLLDPWSRSCVLRFSLPEDHPHSQIDLRSFSLSTELAKSLTRLINFCFFTFTHPVFMWSQHQVKVAVVVTRVSLIKTSDF